MASDPYLGGIFMFAGNFAPRGFALCAGQLLSISQNTALFSILGTTYGGDGVTTFQLPDLRGRSPLGLGNGPNLPPAILGALAGSNSVTILTSNMPAHSHALNASNTAGAQALPTNNVIGVPVDSVGGSGTAFNPTANVTMAPNSIGSTGGSQPLNIQNPNLCINFIIATQGIYPSRN